MGWVLFFRAGVWGYLLEIVKTGERGKKLFLRWKCSTNKNAFQLKKFFESKCIQSNWNKFSLLKFFCCPLNILPICTCFITCPRVWGQVGPSSGCMGCNSAGFKWSTSAAPRGMGSIWSESSKWLQQQTCDQHIKMCVKYKIIIIIKQKSTSSTEHCKPSTVYCKQTPNPSHHCFMYNILILSISPPFGCSNSSRGNRISFISRPSNFSCRENRSPVVLIAGMEDTIYVYLMLACVAAFQVHRDWTRSLLPCGRCGVYYLVTKTNTRKLGFESRVANESGCC